MKPTLQNISLWLFIILGLFSCAHMKFPQRNNLVALNSDITPLNGIYKILPRDSSHNTLWYLLNYQKGKDSMMNMSNFQNLSVQLIGIDRHHLMAKLFDNDILLDEKILKGKISSNYFSVRRKIKYFGLPFVFMKESDWKIQLAKDKYGRLLVDDAHYKIGMIIVFSDGYHRSHNNAFDMK